MTNSTRREEIRELLAHRDRHGLTYRELAEECGSSVHTLTWWAWRLRRESREEVSFTELDFPETRSGSGLEVEAPSGHVVRVPPGFDTSELRRVFEVLASC